MAIGLQRKDLSDVEKELNLPSNQLLAMFVKVVRKVSTAFRAVIAGAVEASLPEKRDVELDGALEARISSRVQAPAVEVDGDDEGEEFDPAMREKQRALIDALPLDKYEIATSTADDTAWEEAERQVLEAGAHEGRSTTVSVKSHKKRKVEHVNGEGNSVDQGDELAGERKGKKGKSETGERKKHRDKEKHKHRTKEGESRTKLNSKG